MIKPAAEKHKIFESQTEKRIYIIGPSTAQNDLIARCLEGETGARCLIGNDFSHISHYAKGTDQGGLILLDCLGKDLKQLLIELRSFGKSKSSSCQVVLFNVEADLENEEKHVWEGVDGVIYLQDPADQLVKGVLTVLRGELWLSRAVMTQCIQEGRRVLKPSSGEETILTPRQVEILALVAVGVTNDEIADKLCISQHTVKTHLYKIYKKINVSNRFQAALWVAKNL